MKLHIGCEEDSARFATEPNIAMEVLAAREPASDQADEWRKAFESASAPFVSRRSVIIGDSDNLPEVEHETLHIPCELPPTALRLWERLGVKLALNTISTATMGRLGRLVSNWMAHVETSNKKLIDRGTRLVAELTGLDYKTACQELHRTIDEMQAAARPGDDRVSPVAATVERLSQPQ
jgi:hypothetical protein